MNTCTHLSMNQKLRAPLAVVSVDIGDARLQKRDQRRRKRGKPYPSGPAVARRNRAASARCSLRSLSVKCLAGGIVCINLRWVIRCVVGYFQVPSHLPFRGGDQAHAGTSARTRIQNHTLVFIGDEHWIQRRILPKWLRMISEVEQVDGRLRRRSWFKRR